MPRIRFSMEICSLMPTNIVEPSLSAQAFCETGKLSSSETAPPLSRSNST